MLTLSTPVALGIATACYTHTMPSLRVLMCAFIHTCECCVAAAHCGGDALEPKANSCVRANAHRWTILCRKQRVVCTRRLFTGDGAIYVRSLLRKTDVTTNRVEQRTRICLFEKPVELLDLRVSTREAVACRVADSLDFVQDIGHQRLKSRPGKPQFITHFILETVHNVGVIVRGVKFHECFVNSERDREG